MCVKIQTLTCFRKLVIVFCMSETKSWKSLIDGSVLFLEVTVTFTRLSSASSAGLQRQMYKQSQVPFLLLWSLYGLPKIYRLYTLFTDFLNSCLKLIYTCQCSQTEKSFSSKLQLQKKHFSNITLTHRHHNVFINIWRP